MFTAMNRFKIVLGREQEFEQIWRERDSHLDNVPGFIKFHLIKGEKSEDHTLYSSHSTWKDKTDFLNWTKSQSFRDAHKGAGQHGEMYLGHPVFEGFEVVL